MTVTIETPDERVDGLKAKAAAQGLTLEDWFQKLASSGNVSRGSVRGGTTPAPYPGRPPLLCCTAEEKRSFRFDTP
jgi:hypothetical protein